MKRGDCSPFRGRMQFGVGREEESMGLRSTDLSQALECLGFLRNLCEGMTTLL